MGWIQYSLIQLQWRQESKTRLETVSIWISVLLKGSLGVPRVLIDAETSTARFNIDGYISSQIINYIESASLEMKISFFSTPSLPLLSKYIRTNCWYPSFCISTTFEQFLDHTCPNITEQAGDIIVVNQDVVPAVLMLCKHNWNRKACLENHAEICFTKLVIREINIIFSLWSNFPVAQW